MFSAAICQQDKGNAAFLKGTKGVRSTGYRFGGTKKDTVNAKLIIKISSSSLYKSQGNLLKSKGDIGGFCSRRQEATEALEGPRGTYPQTGIIARLRKESGSW